jgi:dihydrodipicolinate synthase/N-acetylneuraminate lyase
MSDQPEWDRYYTALVTPFTDDASAVNESNMRSLVRLHLDGGRDQKGIGLIVNPEAGEYFTLSRDERRNNVKFVAEENGGRVPVFAGAGGLTTDDLFWAAEDALESGADGLFVLPPVGAVDVSFGWDAVRYPEVWTDILELLNDRVGRVPLIVHPVTGLVVDDFWGSIPPAGAVEICRVIDNIVGWKMGYSPNGTRKVIKALSGLERHIGAYGAAATMILDMLQTSELDGSVTGSLNYSMDVTMDEVARAASGATGPFGSDELRALHGYIGSDRVHVRFKLAAWLRGAISSPVMRLPFPAPRASEVRTIVDLLARAGLPTIANEHTEPYADTLRP